MPVFSSKSFAVKQKKMLSQADNLKKSIFKKKIVVHQTIHLCEKYGKSIHGI
jgi:hypothetical protein